MASQISRDILSHHSEVAFDSTCSASTVQLEALDLRTHRIAHRMLLYPLFVPGHAAVEAHQVVTVFAHLLQPSQ
jgi:hypothetical protein